MKVNENRLKYSGDMEWTQNSRVNPLTLSLGSWDMSSAHRHTKRNIWVKYHKNQRAQEIWSRHEIQG